ncbi:hypothetical protein [Roseicyclus mahoneyensis]|uniref:Transcriptional regulator n=1 Tax=Roseicyclus mahoneyensis TaxID=164332 RepID=A0A316GJM3_9RHOB|nr:hypothetical protein [Roseicyclus mahoneyensis]PWK61318.1 hypothetical protein C7455_1023 [Roseicyclus mahoneyensis]
MQHVDDYQKAIVREAAASELEYVRKLGTRNDLILACANPGAFEAVLYIMCAGEGGAPVYNAVESVESRFSSPSGIIGRLRAMRAGGLFEERAGRKRSQVCLVPSERLLSQLGPVLLSKYAGNR